jgi:hypothetical protein
MADGRPPDEPEAPISLEEYAFVTAGLMDEIDLADLLACRAIDAPVWNSGREFWEARILDEVALTGGISDRLSALRLESRRLWHRPVPPLDDDLRAWLDFQRTVLSRPNPLAELARIPITLGDLTAIQTLWQERLTSDDELARQVAKILASEPQDVVVPPPPRPCLPASAFPPSPASEEAPVASLPTADDDFPPLSVPLPTDDDETAARLPPGAENSPLAAAMKQRGRAAPSSTVDEPFAPVKPVMPFVAAPVRAPPPAPITEVGGDTVDDQTRHEDPTLPFVTRRRPAPPPEIPLDRTTSIDAGGVGATLPFKPLPLPRRLVGAADKPGRISLGLYAALTVELEQNPGREHELLAAWRLDPKAKRELDEVYGATSDSPDELKRSLAEATLAYRRWRDFC